MSGQIVILEMQDSIATVTLNRPEVHNAFDEKVIEHLTAIFEDLAVVPEITTVVVRGAGKSFSAGGDLNWMQRAANYNEKQNAEDATRLAAMLNRLYTLPKVTIACVQGAAMGGGMGLACCCDIVLAAKDAVFALSEVKLGLIPATIGPYVLRALGERQAKRFFQTGERFTADKALAIGLAHEVVDAADMDTVLETMLKTVAANGPQAMVAAKQLCFDLAGKPITAETIKNTAQLIAKVRAGQEAKEGLSAFLGKRPPRWGEA